MPLLEWTFLGDALSLLKMQTPRIAGAQTGRHKTSWA